MFQRIVRVSFLVVAVVFCSPSAFAGKVELTTYYPAPYGEYQELKSTKDASFATTDGSKVGIGVRTPANPNPVTTLDVAGEVKIGTTNIDCDLAHAGAMRYGAKSVVEYCDGATWKNIGVDNSPNAATIVCDTTNEGGMRYNASLKAMQFCNGSNWTTLGGTPPLCMKRVSGLPDIPMGNGRWSYQDAASGNDFAVICKDGQMITWCHQGGAGVGYSAGVYTCHS